MSLQLSTSLPSPTQLAPPNMGAGLLQSRFRTFSPSPHVFEQSLQLPHLPQLPATVKQLVNEYTTSYNTVYLG